MARPEKVGVSQVQKLSFEAPPAAGFTRAAMRFTQSPVGNALRTDSVDVHLVRGVINGIAVSSILWAIGLLIVF